MYLILFLLLIWGTLCQYTVDQFASLCAMKGAMSVPSDWTCDTSQDPCTFSGLSCGTAGIVTRISLNDDDLFGHIPSQIGRLTYLGSIDLGSNRLSGTIPTQLGNLTALTNLILSDNRLTGGLPGELGALRLLMTFDVSTNRLNGTIAPEISQLVALTRLIVSNNRLIGAVPPFSKLTSLARLELANNLLKGQLSINCPKLLTLLINNNLLGGTFPTEIGLSPLLTFLAMSFNQISGTIPTQIGKAGSLAYFDASENSLGGTLPASMGNLAKLTYLSLNSNILKGEIPTTFGGLIRLARIGLAFNHLSGILPTELGLLQLTQIDFNDNQLSGTIPREFITSSIIIMNLFKNNFKGPVPSLAPMINAKRINLNDNQLSSFPFSDLALLRLDSLLLVRNQITGSLPTEVAQWNLLKLFLGNNQLTGSIPAEFAKVPLLTELSLNDNQLTGSIPIEFELMTNVTRIWLQVNKLTGTVPSNLLISPALRELFLFDNYLKPNTLPISDDLLFFFDPQLSGCTLDQDCQTTAQFHCNTSINFGLGRCVCNSGYDEVIQDGVSSCSDINECLEGTSSVLLSLNNQTCPRKTCVNANGGFFCCPSGYLNPDPSIDGTIDTICTDINECLTGESDTGRSNNTQLSCPRSQCVNIPGSFLCCSYGFHNLDVSIIGNLSSCSDINECLNRDSETLPSNNTNTTCAKSSCVNYAGGFNCCPSGFRNPDPSTDGTLASCQDINECDRYAPLHNCPRQDLCVNTPGTFVCCAENQTAKDNACIGCFGEWRRNFENKSSEFRSLIPFNNIQFDFWSCSDCSLGTRVSARERFSDACNGPIFENSGCSYACKGLTFITTALAGAVGLEKEFRKGNFLEDVLMKTYNLPITWSSKRATNGFSFSFPCTSNTTAAIQLIQSLAAEIMPSAPSLQLTPNTVDPLNCSVSVSYSDPASSSEGLNIGAIIGGAVGGCLLLLFLLGLAYFLFRKSNVLTHLPDEIAWPYQQFKSNPFGWEYRGTKTSGFHFKKLKEGQDHFEKALKLFRSTDVGSNDTSLIIKEITAVYNPILVANFIGSYRIAQHRMDQEFSLFQRQDWKEDNRAGREWVFQMFQKVCARFPWNTKASVNIIPLFHGTDSVIAEKICETGFANLSSLDDGFFGKGIYFTSSSLYTIPFIVKRKSPSIILSWLIPGNVFPVVEGHEDSDSLMGTALKSGYNSHFVCTDRRGYAIDHDPLDDSFFNEFVISQESQVTPVFIYHVERNGLTELSKRWNRTIDLSLM